MSTVGLTKAMREALERVHQNAADITPAMRVKLCERGLVYFAGLCTLLTSRGHAARAAPRMTQNEYEVLAILDAFDGRAKILHGPDATSARSLYRRGFCTYGFGSSGKRAAAITPTGRTALNNVRAAMGSPDWFE